MKSANGKGLVINVTVKAPPLTVPGDVDGDGYVTSTDSALLGNYISKLGDYDNVNLTNSDVDGDGKVSALDRIILTRYIDRDPDITSLPYAPFNQDDISARFSFSSVKAKAGDRVELTLSLDTNPGITTADFNVDFDPSVLTLVDVIDKGLIEGATPAHSDHFESPYRLSWENDLAKTDSFNTGELVTLVFDVAEDADLGHHAVVSRSSEVYSGSLNLADSFVMSGMVEVVKDEPLIDENDEAVMNIADVNRDGLLSVSDVTLIQKYIAGIIPGFGEA